MTQVLWVGHEAECYRLGASANTEFTNVADSGYERAGMKVATQAPGSGNLTSTPDWSATDEIWHRFNFLTNAVMLTGAVLWAAKNASGQIVAQIVSTDTVTAKYQVWDGAAFIDIGAPFSVPTNTKQRYDVHHKGGASGQVEVWAGAPGSQSKVVDATGNYASAVAIVRIFHDRSTGTGVTGNFVAHEIVQTTSTLSSTSEVKPPTSNGSDTDGVGTYTNIDEQTFSDVDVITFSSAGQHQSFKCAARTLTQDIVTGVTVSWRAWYETGGPTSIKPYLTIGGTRYYGPVFAMGLTAQGYQYTWDINPATGVAFTPTEANAAALEWGLEGV